MRVYFTFSRFTLVLAVLWMVMGFPVGVFATEPANESPQLVIAEPSTPANLLNYTEYYETADTKEPVKKEAAPAVEVNCGQNCGSCQNDCGCPRWILGVEAVWLSPQIHDPQIAAFGVGENRTEEIISEYYGPQVEGLYATPRITVGYQGECWGIQGRYWRMSESSEIFVPGTTTLDYDGQNSYGVFKAETIDLEATRMIYWRDTTNQLSFGIRYAQLEESKNVSVVEVDGANIFRGSAYSLHEFGGTGLTMGLAGYKPLNCHFNLFYSARGSVIWDPDTLNSAETRADVLGITQARDIHAALASHSGNMFIGEVQVGTQWNFELLKNRSDAFVRLALEYQYWQTNDTGVASAGSEATNGTFTGISIASSGDSRVDLLGFTVATGFTW